jgi:hypothetical protein
MSDDEWAKDLTTRGAYVLHTPSRTIGKVLAFYEPSEERQGAVLQIAPGHTFFARRENFVELSNLEMAYYESVQAVLHDALFAMTKLGGESKIELPKITTFFVAALQTQLAALQATG